MYLIAGLGNPSKTYEGTRHNVGFTMIDVIGSKFDIDVTTGKHQSPYGPRRDRRYAGDPGEAADLYESERREYSGDCRLL